MFCLFRFVYLVCQFAGKLILFTFCSSNNSIHLLPALAPFVLSLLLPAYYTQRTRQFQRGSVIIIIVSISYLFVPAGLAFLTFLSICFAILPTRCGPCANAIQDDVAAASASAAFRSLSFLSNNKNNNRPD